MNHLEQVVEFLSTSYRKVKKGAVPYASALLLACGGGNGDGDDDNFGRDCSNDLDCRKPRVCESYQCVSPEGYNPDGDVEKPDAGVPDQSSGQWPECPVRDYGECDDFNGVYRLAEIPDERCEIPYDLREFSFLHGEDCQQIIIEARGNISEGSIPGRAGFYCLREFYTDYPEFHDDGSLPARGNHIENGFFRESFTLCNEDVMLLRWENDRCEAWLERISDWPWETYEDCIWDFPM